MSRYIIYYSCRKSIYRDFATKWAKWAAGAHLTDIERDGMMRFFRPIAKRFGLVKEFAALGVLK